MEDAPRRRAPWLALLLGAGGLGLIFAGGWHGVTTASPAAGTVTLVVSARALDAGSSLAAGDVEEVRVPGSAALSSLMHAAGEVVGRRLSVALPSGVPLSPALFAPAPTSPAGHRLVRLQLDAASVPPDATGGALVDVVAALSGPSGEAGRVVTVATGRIAAMSGNSPVLVTLDADAGAAARLIWAQTFAKALHLLVRDGADQQPPPDVTGLGP